MRCKTEFMLCLCGVYRMTHLRQMNAPGSRLLAAGSDLARDALSRLPLSVYRLPPVTFYVAHRFSCTVHGEWLTFNGQR